jgi:phosphomannomutase/phosphoglucomutase
MNVPGHIFREYDIRGVADTELTDPLVRDIGRGLATMLGQSPRIVVGRDCRLSGERLLAALVSGLRAGGASVVEIPVGPTPLLYASVHMLNADGGVMITGSHNPGHENGFKIMRGKKSFFGAEIQELRELIARGVYPERPTGGLESMDTRSQYVDGLVGGIKLAHTDLAFVLDAGNGAGGPLALESMRRLGLRPDPLYCEMDGTFPNHHPDPTVPKNLEALSFRMRETGATLGIAFDGDADRIGAVDASGEIVWGDKLLILFARALLRERPGSAVLGEVKCSQTLYDDIAKHGGRPIMWKTGHSLIKTKMKEEGALLAGEMSGHMFFADRYFGFDDALYAALRLIELLTREGRTMGELLADVPQTFATEEIRVHCPDGDKFRVVEHVRAHYRNTGRPVIDIDGARIDFGTPSAPAWGLVRASNTGAILVLRFEAGSVAMRDALRAEVEAVVQSALMLPKCP